MLWLLNVLNYERYCFGIYIYIYLRVLRVIPWNIANSTAQSVFIRIMVPARQNLIQGIHLLKSEKKKKIVTVCERHLLLNKGNVRTPQVHSGIICSLQLLTFML